MVGRLDLGILVYNISIHIVRGLKNGADEVHAFSSTGHLLAQDRGDGKHKLQSKYKGAMPQTQKIVPQINLSS